MFTNAILPQTTGAVSFKRVIGGTSANGSLASVRHAIAKGAQGGWGNKKSDQLIGLVQPRGETSEVASIIRISELHIERVAFD